MPKQKTQYTEEWREAVRHGAQMSAAKLVPQLYARYNPVTVVDVGAGEGWFAKVFQQEGATDVDTIDGPWSEADLKIDFEDPTSYPRGLYYDLAICLEVAEHVNEDYARPFIDWLSTLAKVIVFSAALPGQGGNGHVNEQWPSYWAGLFAENGRQGSGAFRWEIWDDDEIEGWYRNNLLVFGDPNLPDDGCPDIVHPYLWKLYGH